LSGVSKSTDPRWPRRLIIGLAVVSCAVLISVGGFVGCCALWMYMTGPDLDVTEITSARFPSDHLVLHITMGETRPSEFSSVAVVRGQAPSITWTTYNPQDTLSDKLFVRNGQQYEVLWRALPARTRVDHADQSPRFKAKQSYLNPMNVRLVAWPLPAAVGNEIQQGDTFLLLERYYGVPTFEAVPWL
jgi:hypothetical protein